MNTQKPRKCERTDCLNVIPPNLLTPEDVRFIAKARKEEKERSGNPNRAMASAWKALGKYDSPEALTQAYRLALAIRTKASVAYCSESCRAVTQQRRYRDRKRAA